jgi:excinuclease ABC subunit C
MSFDPQTLSLYPQEPGVYIMKDSKGLVLYVGKAKNLKTRLKQYFLPGRDSREMVPYLTAQVDSIDTIVALTEKDALILENTLIKKHKPKYNVLLKDDKTFISLILTHHKWPLLKLIRYKGTPKNDGVYFGPYTNALAARATYDLLSRLFPLRQCSDSELANRVRPCLLYEIKRCIAPCVGLCSEEEYRGHVDSVTRLLKGKDKEILKDLNAQMEKAAEGLLFEKAQEIKNLIDQLKHITEVQHIDNPEAKDCDALGLYQEADSVMIAQLQFREGKVIGSNHFSFQFIASSNEEILSSFILQHYKIDGVLPKEILLPFEIEHIEVLEDLLRESAPHKITILAPKKGRKQDLVEMAFRNAKALFIREQDTRSLKEKILIDLAETLQLTRFPRRIECFDTSNIGGMDAVASLACFVHGEKDKSRTRLFKIKAKGFADDYTAMKEVLLRHFTKAKERNDFCDLLIVDGGKGQLGIAMDVFRELGIASIDVIALTKEDARHDKGLTAEKIYLPHKETPILIDPKSQVLFFLQKIRDEAHRQAINYHRKQRSKRTFSSALDEIPGIGPTKKKKLLQHFGSVKAIQNASKEELEKVEGLSKKDLENISSHLHKDT